MPERAFQLEPAAAHIAEIFTQQAEDGGLVHGMSRLGDLLLVDQYPPGEDEGLRSFTRGRKSAIRHQFVESHLHGVVFLS